jgi:hypothetical protein
VRTALGIDELALLSERGEERCECLGIFKMRMGAEQLQLAPLMSGPKLRKHQPSKQLGEHPHGQQEVRLACDPAAIAGEAAARHIMWIAARVVGNHRVGVILVACDLPAECRRAAALDGAHHLELVEAHAAAICITPCGPWSRKMSATSRAGLLMEAGRYAGGPSVGSVNRSSGLITVRSTLVATWV